MSEQRHSILHRFSATFVANALGAAMGFATSVMLARGLGAAAYGDYNFLLTSLAGLNMGLEVGTPTAFYTFMSRGEETSRHVRAFGFWLVLRWAAVALAVGILLPGAWVSKLWLGQGRALLVLAWTAFILSGPTRTFVVQVAESVRKTVFVQSLVAGLAVLEAAIIACAWVAGFLTLRRVLFLIAAEWALLCLVFRLRFNWSMLGPRRELGDVRDLASRYAAYCAPLAFYAGLGFVYEFGERWLLQYFGGAIQQGIFSFAFQFTAIATLATNALLNIFWKEIAEAQRLGALDRVRELYRRSSRFLFFVAAAGSCFLIPHSHTVLSHMAGSVYADAWPALALMLLYPAYATIGQLNNVYFFATEDIKTFVAVSSSQIMIALPLSYFLLAPPTARIPGLGLGANGLAARWGLLVMAVVSAQSWIVARRQKAPSDVGHHLAVMAALLCLSFLCARSAAAATGLLPFAHRDLWTLGLAAPLFAAAAVAFVWRFPQHAGADGGLLERVLAWRPRAR